MKKAYLKLALIKPKIKKTHNNEIKDCDNNLTRVSTKRICLKKFII